MPAEDKPPAEIELDSPTEALISLLAGLADAPLREETLSLSEGLPQALSDSLRGVEGPGAALEQLESLELIARVDQPEASFEPRIPALAVRAEPGHLELSLRFLLGVFPVDPSEPHRWPLCEELLPHLTALADRLDSSGFEGLEAIELTERGARFLLAAGRYFAAREMSERAIAGPRAPAEGPLDASLAFTHGRVLYELGERVAAEAELERALAIHQAHLPAGAQELICDRLALAECQLYRGAAPLAGETIATASAEAALGKAEDRFASAARRQDALIKLATGELEEASETIEDALERSRESLGPDHLETLLASQGRALVAQERGEMGSARAQLEELLEPMQRLLGHAHPRIGAICSALGYVCHQAGALIPARAALEHSLEIAEETLPADHDSCWLRNRRLGEVLATLAEPDLALAHFQTALEITRRSLGSEDPRFPGDLGALAAGLSAAGKGERARDTFVAAIESAERLLGEGHPDVAHFSLELGRLNATRGELTQARRRLSTALEAHAALGNEEIEGLCRLELAELLVRAADDSAASSEALGRSEDAEALRAGAQATYLSVLEELLRLPLPPVAVAVAEATKTKVPDLAIEALRRAEQLLEEGRGGVLGLAWAWSRFGEASRERGDQSSAIDAYERAVEMLEDIPAFQGVVLHEVGEMWLSLERTEEAVDYFRRAVAAKRLPGDFSDPLDLGVSLLTLGRALSQVGMNEEAERAYEERLELIRELPEPDRELRAEAVTLHDLADLRLAAGREEEALELLREAAELKRADGADPEDLAATLFSYARLLERRGEYVEAEAVNLERVSLFRTLGESYSRFLGVALHDLADVMRATGRTAEALDLYREAVEAKRREPGNPNDLAASLAMLGRTHEELADYGGAEQTYRERIELIRSTDEPAPLREGAALHDLADSLFAQGRLEEALVLYREAAELKRSAGEALTPENLAVTLMMIATTLLRLSADPEERLAVSSEAVELLRGVEEADPSQLVSALVLNADSAQAAGEMSDAIQLYKEADQRLASSARSATERATLKLHVATTLRREGEEDRAEEMSAEARALLEGVIDSEDIAADPAELQAVCSVCIEGEQYDLAEAILEQGRARAQERPDRSLVLTLDELLGFFCSIREAQSELPEAIELGTQRLELLGLLEEPEPGPLGEALHTLGDLARISGDIGEAAERYRSAARHRRAAGLLVAAFSLVSAGKMEILLDHGGDALEFAEEAEALVRQDPEPEVEGLITTTALRAEAEHALGSYEDALASIGRAEELLDSAGLEDPFKRSWFKELAAVTYKALGRDRDAKRASREAKSLSDKVAAGA